MIIRVRKKLKELEERVNDHRDYLDRNNKVIYGRLSLLESRVMDLENMAPERGLRDRFALWYVKENPAHHVKCAYEWADDVLKARQ